MDANKQNQAGGADTDSGALETPEPTGSTAQASQDQAQAAKPKSGLLSRLKKFNIYIIIFIFLILIGIVIITIAYLQSKKATTTTIKSQNLSAQTLEQLANSDANVGGPNEVLNVESSAVFAGQVLVRDALNAASGLVVSGNTSLQNVNVGGIATIQDATISKSLTVAGTTAIQGSAQFSQGIQVSGNSTFSGSISTPELTTPSFQLNGDLTLTHHFTVGGASPSSSSGSALGAGGTSSVNGSDTAGSISINTGGGPTSGCFINIKFNSAYKQTPYVEITPVGAAAGGLSYYITRDDAGFSVCDATSAPANSSFGFDYFVVD